MSNSIKQISPSNIVFTPGPSTTANNYTKENQFYVVDKYVLFGTSTAISRPDDKLDASTLFEINKISSFLQLPVNWDSYGAIPPAKLAVENAIDFVIRLAKKEQSPFFIAPSPNGDILIELKQENVTLEFLFGEKGTNRVAGLVSKKEIFDKELNDTTEYCSLKWLYCPNGNCFDQE